MPRQVVIELPASLSLGKYLDDPAGLGELLKAIDALTGDPRPTGSVPWGPVMSRLHVARTGWTPSPTATGHAGQDKPVRIRRAGPHRPGGRLPRPRRPGRRWSPRR